MKTMNGFLAGVISLFFSASLFAADQKNSSMDPAMMEAMKRGAPGSDHHVLEPLVGKWKCTVRGWMKPGGPAEVSQGMGDNVWVLGGRFIKQEFKGDWAGMPFEGVGYTGYDNVRQEYTCVWLDNMSTGIMEVSGTFDPKSKVIRTSGHFSCPMTGEKDRWVRSEVKIIDNDNNTYTSYFKGPDGKEFKSMEISYTRVK